MKGPQLFENFCLTRKNDPVLSGSGASLLFLFDIFGPPVLAKLGRDGK